MKFVSGVILINKLLKEMDNILYESGIILCVF